MKKQQKEQKEDEEERGGSEEYCGPGGDPEEDYGGYCGRRKAEDVDRGR